MLEWLIIIALGVALHQLWRRVERIENRLETQEMLARRPIVPVRSGAGDIAPPAVAASPQPEPTPVAAPASAPVATVPAVRRAVARVVGGSAPAASPPAAPVAAPDPHATRRLSINFEELFGRRLPIWAGGITLAIAGFFLVGYAIDLGLLSPFVRVLLGFTFGAGLLMAAFLAERMNDRVDDPRVPQALAGAGLATLYACFYLAGSEYSLIGSGIAFLGLAGVTAVAVWLSCRFGLPCAVIGLVGGFAAPMMVGVDEANLPLLSIYLALVSGGLALTGRRQGRGWLGQAALIGGLLWGLLLAQSQDLSFADQLFVGLYLVALGAGLPALMGDWGGGETPRRPWLHAVAGGFAALQMAALIDGGEYSLLGWGLFGLLAAALAALGWRERALRDASVLATAVAALLLAFWPDPVAWQFALVAGGLTAVLAGVPLAHVWRGSAQRGDIVQLAGAAPAFALAAIWHFGNLFSNFAPVLGAGLLALAALPAVAAWRSAVGDWRAALFEAAAAGTIVLALSSVVDVQWGASVCAAAAIAAALAMPQRLAAARTLALAAGVFALWPLARWFDAGGDALWGVRFALADIASWRGTLENLVPGIVAGLVVAWRGAPFARPQTTHAIAAVAGAGALIAAHSIYKLVFAIGSDAQFVTLGLAERTVWEGLLVAAAAVSWGLRARFGGARDAAIGLAVVALAHFAWFTLFLHNPLWTAQAVGPLPVANLVTASFAIAIAALALLRADARPAWRPGFAIAVMVLLPILAVTLLRQAFGGTILDDGTLGEGEDLLRSLAGIVLAALYLWWGARAEDRVWRIGSLALILLAVGKVFLLDAAELSGLARIASFLALGFSLIGIGWFYARVLARPEARAPAQEIPPQVP